MKAKLVIGNWKMNETFDEAQDLIGGIADSIEKLTLETSVVMCPPFPYLELATDLAEDNGNFSIGAQNCSEYVSGAYTGEVSAKMLASLEVDFCIVGHSERRTYDNETSEKCNKKIKALLANDMIPVYCCGETLEQFEAGETKAVVAEQIRKGFEGVSAEDAKKCVVAYEPIWSIGTGKNASAEIAEDICKFIRKVLRSMVGSAANKIRILYGGSVKPSTIEEQMSKSDIDGALVGGASLKADRFINIINLVMQN